MAASLVPARSRSSRQRAERCQRNNIIRADFFNRILFGIHQPEIGETSPPSELGQLEIFTPEALEDFFVFLTHFPASGQVFACADSLSIHDRVTVYREIFTYLAEQIKSFRSEKSRLTSFVWRWVQVAFYRALTSIFSLDLPEHEITRFIQAWSMKLERPEMTCSQVYNELKKLERGQIIRKLARFVQPGQVITKQHDIVHSHISRRWQVLRQIAHAICQVCTCVDAIPTSLPCSESLTETIELREEIQQFVESLPLGERLGLALFCREHNLPHLEFQLTLEILLAWVTIPVSDRQRLGQQAVARIKRTPSLN